MKAKISQILVPLLFLGFTSSVQAHLTITDSPTETPLGILMEQMGGKLRELSRQVRNSEMNVDSIAKTIELESIVAQTLPLIPKKIQDMEVDLSVKQKETLEYKRQMISVYNEVLKLEELLHEEKNDETMDVIKELVRLRNEGHDRFQE